MDQLNKKKLISKLYHVNLQLIDKLYNRLEYEWDIFYENDLNNNENELNNNYNQMINLNNELNELLNNFNEKEENDQCMINWNQTMLELLPVIWFYYLYKFHS